MRVRARTHTPPPPVVLSHLLALFIHHRIQYKLPRALPQFPSLLRPSQKIELVLEFCFVILSLVPNEDVMFEHKDI